MFGLTRQYLMIGGGIALALFAAWSFRVNHLRALHLESLLAERVNHAQTITNYRDAQKLAQMHFDAKIAEMKAKNEERNHEADNRVANLSAEYSARVMRLKSASAACAARVPGMPETNLPEGDNGRGEDTVILERADALICAENTGRLQAIHEWALETE